MRNTLLKLLFPVILLCITALSVTINAAAAVSSKIVVQSTSVKASDTSSLILIQPTSWVSSEGATVFFELDVSDSVISCQWQISRNNGNTWLNSSVNGTFYSTAATADKEGYLYRCIVKSADGREEISDIVSFSLTDDFHIAVHPTTVSAEFGTEVSFCVQAGGRDVKFEWQRSDDGKIWNAFGTKKARVNQTLQRYNVGRYYRCVVTNSTGEQLISNVVQLKWNDTGFFTEDSKTYYVKENGCLALGAQKINGKVYVFSDSGIMRTGFIKHNDNIYYLSDKGIAATGFTYVPAVCNTLYFKSNGAAATGWTTISGKTYYFYESGAMARGVTQIGKGEYFFDQKTGVRTYGMVQIGPNNYMYFQKGKTAPYTGLKEVDGALYYFAESGINRGITQGGYQTIAKKSYYFDPVTKKAATGMVEYGSNTLYFSKDHTMVTNKIVTVRGKKYYFDSNGYMRHGLVIYKDQRYYFDPVTGQAVSGWVTLNGAKLYFDPDSYTAKTGFVTIKGVKYNFTANGYLKTGISKIKGTHYYLTEPGQRKTGFIEVNKKVYYVYSNQKVAKGLKTINKKLYFFDDNGVMRTGLRSVNGVRYYFDTKTGAAVKGFVQTSTGYVYYFNGASGAGSGLTKINGNLYCLSEKGIVRYGRIRIGKKYYFFDPASGKALTGWQSIVRSNKEVGKAYFDPKTHCAVTGLKTIDGKLYYFDENGWVKSGIRQIKGIKYFFAPGTNAAYTGWYKNTDGTQSYYNGAKGKLIGPDVFKIDGKYYYIDGHGRRLTGERTVNGEKLYFDPVTAELVSKNTSSSNKTPAPVQPKKAATWGKIDGVKCFYGMNGKPLTGLQIIDGKLYYFAKTGKMKTGMLKVSGSYYYFGKSGAVSGQVKINGKEYYFSPLNFKRQTGIQKVGSIYCYYNENGIRQKGWVTTADGDRLYFTFKGLQTGLAKISGKTYFFGEDGKMKTGLQQVTASNGTQMTCLFNKKGILVTGLVSDSTGIYYYSTKTGNRVTGFAEIDGKQYYFDPGTGKAKTGLHNIDGVYCFFDTKTAQRKYGLQKVSGKLYYFTNSTSSAGLSKGLKVVNKKTYYFSAESGAALSGCREINGVMYYFDPVSFASVTAIRRRANDAAYLFKAGGGIKTGWQKVGSKTYYFYPTTGKMAEGLVSVKDKLYYFDYSKGLLRNTKVKVGDVTYQLDKNGYAVAMGSSNLSKMINAGITHFGKGYGSDGKTDDPQKFTCSQLVSAVYKVIGIELPERSARQYYTLTDGNFDTTIIESIDQAKPGDLVFFSTVNCSYGSECDFWSEIHHVAIYLGDGKIMGSFDIKGDTENNGPMIRDIKASGSIIFSIIRIKDVNK